MTIEATPDAPLSEVLGGTTGLTVAGRGFCCNVMNVMGYGQEYRELATAAPTAPAATPDLDIAARANNFLKDFGQPS